MQLYVFQRSDESFDCGFSKEYSELEGTIVETWPLNTKADADYLASTGSKLGGAGPKSNVYGNLARGLLFKDRYDGAEILVKPEFDRLVEEKAQIVRRELEDKIGSMTVRYEAEKAEQARYFNQSIHDIGAERDNLIVEAKDEYEHALRVIRDTINDEIKAKSLKNRLKLALNIIFRGKKPCT